MLPSHSIHTIGIGNEWPNTTLIAVWLCVADGSSIVDDVRWYSAGIAALTEQARFSTNKVQQTNEIEINNTNCMDDVNKYKYKAGIWL